ncbi:MAG: D-alanyl-D-alanine carboxypeptidase [Defluviitaleaceae bacterium]|nr:D-alanyl-D-alanine carboxypeptidase [Defluviitaleaceae bacterium]
MRKLCALLIFLMSFYITPMAVHGTVTLTAPSAILIDRATGRVLYSYNEHARMYPAGLTKMLTALVVLDYMDPDDIIVVGTEIYNVPRTSILSGHQAGEHITVHNLLRGLMTRNGNDSAVVLALNTVRIQRNNHNVPFVPGMEIFSGMMNERAEELGAVNTHFVNPTGLHNDNHYTTAYDLALISQAFMEHPLLREIAGEAEFIGNSLGDLVIEGAHTINHNWEDSNQLISGGAFHYSYATGIRSGTTSQAGDCVAASASRRGVNLIAVVLGATDPERWHDARALFEYGFSTYEYHELLEVGQNIKTASIPNAMLGGDNILDVLSADNFTYLLSASQVSRLERHVIFEDRFVEETNDYYSYDYYELKLLAPIMYEERLGSVIYILDDQVIFEGAIIAAQAIQERSLDSDMDFYIALVINNVFSLQALPYWLGVAGVLIGIAGIFFAVNERRRSRRSWYSRR